MSWILVSGLPQNFIRDIISAHDANWLGIHVHYLLAALAMYFQCKNYFFFAKMQKRGTKMYVRDEKWDEKFTFCWTISLTVVRCLWNSTNVASNVFLTFERFDRFVPLPCWLLNPHPRRYVLCRKLSSVARNSWRGAEVDAFWLPAVSWCAYLKSSIGLCQETATEPGSQGRGKIVFTVHSLFSLSGGICKVCGSWPGPLSRAPLWRWILAGEKRKRKRRAVGLLRAETKCKYWCWFLGLTLARMFWTHLC